MEQGRADVVLGPPVERLQGLLTRYPGRLHSDAVPWTDYMFLNTRVAPFDDLRVRQALNYAVDRARMVESLGGPLAAQPTCQLLPPAVPGYRPYCPYTLGRSPGGAWTAPDLARARALGRSAGTSTSRRLRPSFSSFVPESASNRNLSAFCDSGIDATMARAAELQASAPVRANALWSEADRALVDQAAAVPLVNQHAVGVVSERVGNYQLHPQWLTLLDQLWVR